MTAVLFRKEFAALATTKNSPPFMLGSDFISANKWIRFICVFLFCEPVGITGDARYGAGGSFTMGSNPTVKGQISLENGASRSSQ
jgi:hypothetical protein